LATPTDGSAWNSPFTIGRFKISSFVISEPSWTSITRTAEESADLTGTRKLAAVGRADSLTVLRALAGYSGIAVAPIYVPFLTTSSPLAMTSVILNWSSGDDTRQRSAFLPGVTIPATVRCRAFRPR